ncbi:MAG: hypothetical protein M1820_005378 [Bogoriella megaspora]|nr:MAG: hypothetical protein M1820_005378 [Bogoriella megaspora]
MDHSSLPQSDDEEDGELSAFRREPPSPVAIGGRANHRTKGPVPEAIRLFSDHERNSALDLTSKTSAEPIRCSIVVVPFSQLGKGRFHFEALSYSWGDDEPTSVIYLREHTFSDANNSSEHRTKRSHNRSLLRHQHDSTGSPFRVRNNLLSALTQLRHPSYKIHLWIDAVSINQDNNVEKSHQISKMAIIYSKARNVRIWLGESDPVLRSDEGMNFVDKIADLKLLDRLVTWDPTNYLWNVATAQSWVAFANILKRSWFRRRWVIQEVAFAESASVQCGDIEKNWSDFADAIELFVEKLDQIRVFHTLTGLAAQDPDAFKGAEAFGAKALVAVTGNIFRKPDSGHVFERTWNIETLVSKLGSFEVTDPRDAIFALSSMAKDGPLDLPTHQSDQVLRALQVDYGKHPVEVYTDFVRHSIQSTKTLDIICRHWAFPVSEDDSIIQNWWFKAASAWVREGNHTNMNTFQISDENITIPTGLELEQYRSGPDFHKLSLDHLTDFLIALDSIIRQLKQFLPYLGDIKGGLWTNGAIRAIDPVEDARLYGFVAQNLLKLRETVMNIFITKLFLGPDNRLSNSKEASEGEVTSSDIES